MSFGIDTYGCIFCSMDKYKLICRGKWDYVCWAQSASSVKRLKIIVEMFSDMKTFA